MAWNEGGVVEREVILALGDVGEVITLLIALVVIVWLLTKVITLAINRWSEAAKERNMIEAKRNDADERVAMAYERLSDALTTVASHMAVLSASQQQMAAALADLNGMQRATDETVKEGFKTAGEQMASGFEGVDKGMDELQQEIHSMSGKQTEMMADITTVKDQIEELLQRTESQPALHEELTNISTVTNRIWAALQTMLDQKAKPGEQPTDTTARADTAGEGDADG
jgi:chromosome segregation ATPase